MNNVSTLKNLGLSDQEALIYLELLKLGGTQASKLAKSMGIKRTTVYPILKKLADSGFVTVYFRKNRRYYYAQKPQRVASLFGKKLDSFYAMIPLLESLEKKDVQMSGLRFIETLDELKQFYTGVLDEYRDKQYCIIGSAQGWEDLDMEWFRQFRYDRGRNNIKTKLLLTEDSREINPVEEKLLRDFRYVPSQYQFRSTIDIFEDQILVVSPELSSLAIVIQIPAMYDIFKAMFDMLWDTVGLDKTLDIA
ncbi:MAG: helix-turn-helix domain-containing protein [Candidatus Magasanikbacteria bacterium]|nr:helix-turn-helix domain-containing protein [Candidatus Magasanikbacteria bacterium]